MKALSLLLISRARFSNGKPPRRDAHRGLASLRQDGHVQRTERLGAPRSVRAVGGREHQPRQRCLDDRETIASLE